MTNVGHSGWGPIHIDRHFSHNDKSAFHHEWWKALLFKRNEWVRTEA